MASFSGEDREDEGLSAHSVQWVPIADYNSAIGSRWCVKLLKVEFILFNLEKLILLKF